MEYKRLLEETGAILHGHFLLSSGLHSDSYVQCAKILKYPWYAEDLGYELSVKISKYNPDCVISPAIGGIIIGYEVARHLNVPFLFAERDDDGVMKFRREFDPSDFKNIAVVEDVITTGKSTSEIIDLVEKAGSRVICASSIVNRGSVNQIREIHVLSLVDLPLTHYTREECPLCQNGIPLVKPGTRKMKES
ncbi:orotate phosphoribosyltransferase [Athalassotoga saccharophila]|uniref:orotate phosphoribosyltransferase n=1 Tax=Athalassotoga saccharophila TaxID=1441386 RepID=UPI00137AFA9C|nr:orotate phosphoribosyltransferase [Athalassotoga saccharophila]BBJ27326.1 orotate phosphoribosyltransferase [Athalassotoga saccharophila]